MRLHDQKVWEALTELAVDGVVEQPASIIAERACTTERTVYRVTNDLHVLGALHREGGRRGRLPVRYILHDNRN